MKALRYLNKYFIKYKYSLLLGLFITIISRIFSLFMPHFIGNSLNVVDEYLKGSGMALAAVKEQLLFNILIIIRGFSDIWFFYFFNASSNYQILLAV